MAIFCFTDIEGSTEKWEKHKSVMGQVITRHNQIFEENLARFGGQLIKHTGDGIYAIFDGAAGRSDAALQFALQVQRQVQAEVWPGFGELRVRMAFHCGEAEKMGGDYFGPVANRTARLMALGWGGQILVSEDLMKLGVLPAGATLQDLGVHQVKDLAEPQQVYGLLHPDLKLKEFPALKSLSRPHNLPAQLTPFVDREKELAEIGRFFAASNHRLLTLRGAGGMGKTRLCIQAGLGGILHFKHGVYFVALEALSSPEQIVPAIAASLRLPFYSHEDPKEQLLGYLHDRELLLILDNADHLSADLSLLSEILLAAPQVKILASSRAKLEHHSESVLEISGLDPAGSQKLFLQRARKVKVDFVVRPDEQDLLARICAQVEGMPLGLELAAAWVKTLSLKEICRRLETSIALLVSSEKDLPERQRSMRALFDYSWKLLSPEEQKHYRGLCVFVDSFSAEAGQMVAQCDHARLMSLVNKSLLQAVGDDRYLLPQFLRPFAQAKLDLLPPEKQQMLNLHSQYYCRFLKSKEAAVLGLGQAQGLADLSRDLGNLKRAWKHAVEKGLVKQLSQGARCLGAFLEIRCLSTEWLPVMEQALALWGGLEQRAFAGASPEEALRAFAALSIIVAEGRFNAGRASDQDTAKAYEKAVQSFKKIQAREEAAYAQVRLGQHALAEAAKTAALNEAASTYRLAGDRNGEAWAKAELGGHLWAAVKNAEGKRMLVESLAVFRELGNIREEARGLAALGTWSLEEGRTGEGVQQHRAAKDLLTSLGDLEGAAGTMAQLARFFIRQGAWKEAQPFGEEALGIFGALRHDRGEEACSKDLAEVYWALGDLPRALANVERSLLYIAGLKEGEQRKAQAYLEKSAILLRQDNLAEALTLAVEAQRLLQAGKNSTGAAEAMELQGDIHLAMGSAAKAREQFKNAQLEFSQAGAAWRGRAAWDFVRMADAEVSLDQGAEARRDYGRAFSKSEAQGPEDYMVAALRGLALVLVKEKKGLDALRLLAMGERLGQDPKLTQWRPRAFARARQEAAAQFQELKSKLMQNVVDEAQAWARGMALPQFIKETLAKYCS